MSVHIEAAEAASGVLPRRIERAALSARPFPVGRVLDIRSVEAQSVQGMMVDYDRDYLVSGDWFSQDCHFFDMSFSQRSQGARGYFQEVFTDPRPLGKVFFAPAGHPYHGEGGEGRQRSLSLFVNARQLADEETQFGEGLLPVLHNCLRLESDNVRDLLIRISQEISEPGFGSSLMLEGLSLTLLVETARLLTRLSQDEPHKGGLSPWRLKTIDARVRDSGSPPSLAELAALCQLSRRQLIRAFRAETGQTIGTFVQSVMMERAKGLLIDGSLSISEIAVALGFGTAAGFSTAFRRHFGQSPRVYRTTHSPVDAHWQRQKNSNRGNG
jgi:AraC family transcriptional regulator